MASDLFHADRRGDRYEEINRRFSQMFFFLRTRPNSFPPNSHYIHCLLISLSAINPVFLTNNNSTRQAIYVYRNIVEISRTLCTSSFILVDLYHFNRIEGFYGEIMTPTTVKHT